MKNGTSTAPRGIADLRSALLNIALKFGVGVNRRGRESDWTVDCREVLLSSTWLALVARELWPLIRSFDPTAVGGETLGADPLVAALLLQAATGQEHLKGFIVRKSPKPYGTRRRVEGPALTSDDRVVVIDDLINTATTYRRVAGAIAETGAQIVAVATVVDLQRTGSLLLQDLKIPLVSLVTATDLGLGVQLPERTAASELSWMVQVPAGRPLQLLGETADGSVLALSEAGDLTCLNQNGQVRWERTAPVMPAGPNVHVALAGQTVVSVTAEALCLADLTSGELVCRRPYISSVAVAAHEGAGGRGVAVCAGPQRQDRVTHVEAVDLATAATQWRTTLRGAPTEPVGIGTNRDKAFVVDRARSAHALSISTGEEVWRADLPHPAEVGPVVSPERVYVGCGGEVVALASDTGAVVWRRRLARHLERSPTLAPRLLIMSVRRRIVALDQETGRIEWLHNVGERLVGSPICSGGFVVVCSGKRAHLLDPATGRLQTTVALPTEAISGPAPVPGGYVVCCRGGICRYVLSRPTLD